MRFIGTRVFSAGAACAFMAWGVAGICTVAQAQPPQLTMQSEEAAHPRLVKAIHEMHHALDELRAAPDDFGGRKEQAIKDTEQAIHSLKRALYFRLKMDDAAIDRVQ